MPQEKLKKLFYTNTRTASQPANKQTKVEKEGKKSIVKRC
jgi:hypothetical protein